MLFSVLVGKIKQASSTEQIELFGRKAVMDFSQFKVTLFKP
jgi:hypothetical protein